MSRMNKNAFITDLLEVNSLIEENRGHSTILLSYDVEKDKTNTTQVDTAKYVSQEFFRNKLWLIQKSMSLSEAEKLVDIYSPKYSTQIKEVIKDFYENR